MAHPDHDQVIGRLVAARLRGAGDPRPGGADAVQPCPDAEAWAAYVDGGVTADEVIRFDTHLADCPACRRLVAMLTSELSAVPAITPREAAAPILGSAVVIPFPRRQMWAWMGIAAGLLAAVTLWSVSRLGSEPPVLRTADSRAPLAAPAPSVTGLPESSLPVDTPAAPAAAPLDRLAATPAPEPPAQRAGAPQEPAQVKGDASRDKAGRRQRPADPTALTDAAAGRAAPGAAVPAGGAGRFQEGAKPQAEPKRSADAAPAAPGANARTVTLQTNAVVAGVSRPHGPLANQQNVNQQNVDQRIAPALNAPAPPPLPAQAAAAPATAAPAPIPPPTPVAAPAVAEANPVDARERRANEGQIAEVITTTGAAGSRADAASQRRGAARAEPARAQPAGAERDGDAAAKEELAKTPALGYAAAAVPGPVFAEPGGRLRWRIADGRRLESSSDSGVTWARRYTTARGDRLRAGTAPAIDSAWAVGERGLVLRLAVPGGWSAVKRPVEVGLIAVSATGADAARVTAEDGRVFATTDGGATWTLVTPGAGPQ
jgi:hypothetical protein